VEVLERVHVVEMRIYAHLNLQVAYLEMSYNMDTFTVPMVMRW
jgi:hypothetical protein